MRVLFCEACDRKVAVDNSDEFNYTNEGAGPFCETCWFFVLHIEALRARVTDLEEQFAVEQKQRIKEAL